MARGLPVATSSHRWISPSKLPEAIRPLPSGLGLVATVNALARGLERGEPLPGRYIPQHKLMVETASNGASSVWREGDRVDSTFLVRNLMASEALVPSGLLRRSCATCRSCSDLRRRLEYAYRPKRGAADAIKEVHRVVCRGYTLPKYFGNIPRRELMLCVARRIVDRSILALIKMWLRALVEERDGDGTRRMPGGKGSTRGTPQGGVASPLLANHYMDRVDY